MYIEPQPIGDILDPSQNLNPSFLPTALNVSITLSGANLFPSFHYYHDLKLPNFYSWIQVEQENSRSNRENFNCNQNLNPKLRGFSFVICRLSVIAKISGRESVEEKREGRMNERQQQRSFEQYLIYFYFRILGFLHHCKVNVVICFTKCLNRLFIFFHFFY